MSDISSVFGEKFAIVHESHLQQAKRKRVPRLKEDPVTIAMVLEEALANLRPDVPMLNYLHDGTVYHVLLVKSPIRATFAKETRYGKSALFKWNGMLLTGYFGVDQDHLVAKLEPDKSYLVVGQYAFKNYNNKTYHSVSVHLLFTLDEIAAYKEDKNANKLVTDHILKDRENDLKDLEETAKEIKEYDSDYVEGDESGGNETNPEE